MMDHVWRTEMRRVQIGVVGVDSGQLMIVDPCYLSDYKDQEYNLKHGIKIKATGEILLQGTCGENHDFFRWDQPVEKLGGKTPTEALADGEIEHWDEPMRDYTNDPNGFNYNTVCQLSHPYGQVMFAMGHAGRAVVFGSGYGDGCYPVYGYLNDEGRVMKVEIDMGEHDYDYEDEE
jgi:hypothetical protein